MRAAVLTLFLLHLPAPAQDGPSVADFDAQVARLTPTASRDDRVQAARWLQANRKSPHAPRAMPALAKLVRKDPEAEVRQRAVVALLLIATEHKKPCPLAVVEAVRDPDESVRVNAAAGLFKEFEPGAVGVLLDGTRDDRADVRSDCVTLLAVAGPKDPKALAAIEAATADRHAHVRHNAHCARFKATDDLGAFLTYLIRLREDPASARDQHPAGSEAEKFEQARYSLCLIAAATLLVEWSNRRPDDLAAALVKLLDDRSPVLRRGAANLVGATARKVELKQSGPVGPDIVSPDTLAAVLASGAAAGPAEPSPAALRLRDLKVEDRLKELSDKDPDESVRLAAFTALRRLAEVPARKK